jgi:hypothetical protein
VSKLAAYAPQLLQHAGPAYDGHQHVWCLAWDLFCQRYCRSRIKSTEQAVCLK